MSGCRSRRAWRRCALRNVKRRLELRGTVRGVEVYDDFAHHPTAIATTLAGLRRKVAAAAFWPFSNRARTP
jgi:UDP-N-acetylmuramate-alanine ligase